MVFFFFFFFNISVCILLFVERYLRYSLFSYPKEIRRNIDTKV